MRGVFVGDKVELRPGGKEIYLARGDGMFPLDPHRGDSLSIEIRQPEQRVDVSVAARAYLELSIDMDVLPSMDTGPDAGWIVEIDEGWGIQSRYFPDPPIGNVRQRIPVTPGRPLLVQPGVVHDRMGGRHGTAHPVRVAPLSPGEVRHVTIPLEGWTGRIEGTLVGASPDHPGTVRAWRESPGCSFAQGDIGPFPTSPISVHTGPRLSVLRQAIRGAFHLEGLPPGPLVLTFYVPSTAGHEGDPPEVTSFVRRVEVASSGITQLGQVEPRATGTLHLRMPPSRDEEGWWAAQDFLFRHVLAQRAPSGEILRTVGRLLAGETRVEAGTYMLTKVITEPFRCHEPAIVFNVPEDGDLVVDPVNATVAPR